MFSFFFKGYLKLLPFLSDCYEQRGSGKADPTQKGILAILN